MAPVLAVIDIGSNSGRVVVVRPGAGRHLEILADAGTQLRLVREIDAGGRLTEVAIERTIAAVRDFQGVAQAVGAERTRAVATAAVRSAHNRAEFVTRIEAATGVHVRIIDGEQEGRYAFAGAVQGLPVDDGLLLDIGGGSVEISHFLGRRMVAGWTLPLGALLLSDRFLRADPPRPGEMDGLTNFVSSSLAAAGVPRLDGGEQLIGTGGTVRNVAKIHRAGIAYPIARMHGYVLSHEAVGTVTTRVAGRRLARRTAIPGVSADRAEVIPGGALVLQAVMSFVGAAEIVVSGQGLREGVALAEIGGGLPSTRAVRAASLTALTARFSTWDPIRAARRRAVVKRLVDLLDPDTPAEILEIIEVAATVADTGRSVDFYDRWSHASTIVVGADLQGFSHRAVAILAALLGTVARERSSLRPYAELIGADERRRVERGSVLLALADEIDKRLRPGQTRAVIGRREQRRGVVLRVPSMPGWRPVALAKRFRRVFGVELIIEVAGD